MSDPTVILPSDEGWGKRFNAYGAMFITVSVFVLLFMGMAVAAWRNDAQAFNVLMETVKAMAMMVVGFWIGSSKSSQDKDATIQVSAAKLASTPAAVAPVAAATKTTVTTTEEEAHPASFGKPATPASSTTTTETEVKPTPIEPLKPPHDQ